jgi:hypothetical protein
VEVCTLALDSAVDVDARVLVIVDATLVSETLSIMRLELLMVSSQVLHTASDMNSMV